MTSRDRSMKRISRSLNR